MANGHARNDLILNHLSLTFFFSVIYEEVNICHQRWKLTYLVQARNFYIKKQKSFWGDE